MATTTIRLEEKFKDRLARAAERAGKSTHAFILDALAETVEQCELAEDFDAVAEGRWAQLIATGKSVAWDDARGYLEGRARGEHPPRPGPRKPRS